MEKKIEDTTTPKLEPREAIHYLWEEYKMRQAHYWASFNRFALAIITVLVIPYIKPENVESFGRSILFLPIFGLILSLTSTWLLGAEYQRLRSAKDRYVDLLAEDYKPKYPVAKNLLQRIYFTIFGLPIGYITVSMFGFGLSALSIADYFLLRSKVGN
jgi:hypothetical protein